MKISYNWLSTYFDKKLPPPEKLAELFTFHFSEVEGLERVGDDFVFDLKILPDRAHYALSHKGVAGEISALTHVPAKNRYMSETLGSGILPKMKIEDETFCTRMVARYIDGVNGQDSPVWLKTALEAVGQRSINAVVDLTNYVMFDIGQPLHAFDADKLKGDIVIRRAHEGERIVLLDGREVTLTATDGVIADEAGPLDIAGIKGGKRAEVSKDTRRILLVSDNFHPASIRKTSTKYNLRNEASKRFENQITLELAPHGMNNMSSLVKEVFPQATFGPVLDLYPGKEQQTRLTLDPQKLSERLGIDIPNAEVKDILQRLGIEVEEQKSLWVLTIPFERLDLTIPEDIVEEVGRMYGYEKLKGTLPPPKAESTVLPAFYYSEKIKDILVRLGFSEVYTYSLVAKGDIEIEKPLAADKRYLRTNLKEGIKKSLDLNEKNADLLGLDEIKIFEIGRVFPQKGEHLALSIGVRQTKKKKGERPEDVISAAQKEIEKTIGMELGGKIEQGILEVNLTPIIEVLPSPKSYDLASPAGSKVRYASFPPYPFIVRDVALFVSPTTTPEAVENVLAAGKSQLVIKGPTLFDDFAKDGKRSLAFRFIFQAFDRTLTDDEVNVEMKKIYQEVEKNGWQVR